VSLTVTERIRAILAGRPVPPLPMVLTAGEPVVLVGPDPDLDDEGRRERADYDDREAADPN
jgi:hypothetical protein